MHHFTRFFAPKAIASAKRCSYFQIKSRNIEYKEYKAVGKSDELYGLFFSTVINSGDIISFDGKTANELKQFFEAVIEEYLEDCRKLTIAVRSAKMLVSNRAKPFRKICNNIRRNYFDPIRNL